MRTYYTAELSSSMRRLALFTDILQYIANCNFDSKEHSLEEIAKYIGVKIAGFEVHTLEINMVNNLLVVTRPNTNDSVVMRVRAFKNSL